MPSDTGQDQTEAGFLLRRFHLGLPVKTTLRGFGVKFFLVFLLYFGGMKLTLNGLSYPNSSKSPEISSVHITATATPHPCISTFLGHETFQLFWLRWAGSEKLPGFTEKHMDCSHRQTSSWQRGIPLKMWNGRYGSSQFNNGAGFHFWYAPVVCTAVTPSQLIRGGGQRNRKYWKPWE